MHCNGCSFTISSSHFKAKIRDMEKTRRKSSFLFILPVPTILFFILFKQVDLTSVKEVLLSSHKGLVLACLSLTFINIVTFISYRWHIMMRAMGYSLSFKESVKACLFCDSVIDMSPMKTGEVYKAYYLKRVAGIEYKDALLISFLGYALNFVCIILAILIGGAFLWRSDGRLLPLYFCGITGLRGKLSGLRKHFSERSLEIIKDRKVIFLTIAIWVTEFTIVWLMSVAVGHPISFAYIMCYIPMVVLLSHLPITFGGLGVREFSMVVFFSGIASPDVILSWALLYGFCEYFFSFFLGIFFTGFSLRRIVDSFEAPNG